MGWKSSTRLRDKGLVVLGFPSNDFGEQEPGSDKEIADFCRLTYGVEFPMVAKTTVKGKDANPFYLKLAEITGSKPKLEFPQVPDQSRCHAGRCLHQFHQAG
jgi:glutathione peroxidase